MYYLYFRAVKTIFLSASATNELMLFLTRENKIHIFMRHHVIFLFLIGQTDAWKFLSNAHVHSGHLVHNVFISSLVKVWKL